MNLEHELGLLPIAFPDEPDLVPGVLARLERPRRRVWLIPALAVLAAVGALLAIPQTRAAILDLFRVGGVEIRRVETQPQAPVQSQQLGRRVTLADARDAVDFPLLVPAAGFATYLDDTISGGMVNLRWNGYVLSQWRGEQVPYARKQVGPNSQVTSMVVRGAIGLWITGARHEILFSDARGEVIARSRRLAGDVLIWEQGGITYRLEGPRSLDEALAVARNLRAP